MWFLWLIVAIAVIVLCFKFPKFRIGVAVIVGLIVLIVGGFLVKSDYDEKQAARRITPDQIEISDLELSKDAYPKLTGRIRNNSPKYTLTSFTLKLTMHDVMKGGKKETVGESEQYIYANVPPGQSRAFEEFVSFSGLGKPRGEFQWRYEVKSIRGQ